jgi:hypothetical protein
MIMANTICLSTDMQTFYLIPNPGTRKKLSLRESGVNVSLSGNDVNATAASGPTTGTQDTYSMKNGQWTVFYDSTAAALEFIGVIDMDGAYHKTYSLSSSSINIRVAGNDIIVTV